MKFYKYWMIIIVHVFVFYTIALTNCLASEIAIITFSGSGEVGFISIENAKVLKKINLLGANFPERIAVTPDNEIGVVACATGNICFLNLATLECIKNLELFRGPEQHGITLHPNEFKDICITPDGGRAIVTESNGDGQLFSIDIETMELSLSDAPITIGDDLDTVIVDSNGIYAYLLEEGNIHKVNLEEKTYTTFLQPAEATNDVRDFALTPNESRAIFIDDDNWISLVDTSSWGLIEKKQVDTTRFTEPIQVAVSPDGATAVVANATDPSITFVSITPTSITILDTIEVGGSTGGVAFTQNSQIAVVTVHNPNLVQIIDVPNRQIKATISENLGLMPTGVAIIGDETGPTSKAMAWLHLLLTE